MIRPKISSSQSYSRNDMATFIRTNKSKGTIPWFNVIAFHSVNCVCPEGHKTCCVNYNCIVISFISTKELKSTLIPLVIQILCGE